MKLRTAQFVAAAGLSMLFMIVYGGCNAITAMRDDVGVIYFEWEKYIPFVPILIIPYMSIDLFFVGAPFLCKDKDELSVFSKRITTGILISGICFLLLPLTLAHERPQVEGLLGEVFAFLHGFDQPYNLLPSLHIILRTILAQKYAQRTRGRLRAIVHLWFFLIGISTLLVYQHHVIDVVAGFVVATAIFYCIPSQPRKIELRPNPRIGCYYLVGCILLGLLAWTAQPWTLLLAWPAGSMAVVAAAYFLLGHSITVKRQGRISLGGKFVLWPWLIGQKLSLVYYRKQCDPWNAVTPNVWIGRKLSNIEAEAAVEQGVESVIDLTCEFSEAAPFIETNYLNIQVLDLTAPTMDQLSQAAMFIEEQSRTGFVYVHCKIGYSRSVAVIAAWLLQSNRAETIDDAIAMIRDVRPSIVVRPEIRSALEQFTNELAAK